LTLGHAWFAPKQYVVRAPIKVDLLFTIDPVSYVAGFIPNKRITYSRNDLASTERWINYYQNYDKETLGGLYRLVGSQTAADNLNDQLVKKVEIAGLFIQRYRPWKNIVALGPFERGNPDRAHVWIPYVQRIRNEWMAQVRPLLNAPYEINDYSNYDSWRRLHNQPN
jgi:hypothetical protein